METGEWVSVDEAAAELASVERSQRRVAWLGYQWWYLLLVGVVLCAMPLATVVPKPWYMVATAGLTAGLAVLTWAGCRVRGVCESWRRSPMRLRDGALLFGPTCVVLVTGSLLASYAVWVPVVAAGLGFSLFVGTGLLLGRAARR